MYGGGFETVAIWRFGFVVGLSIRSNTALFTLFLLLLYRFDKGSGSPVARLPSTGTERGLVSRARGRFPGQEPRHFRIFKTGKVTAALS
jgi:hypothetical protein